MTTRKEEQDKTPEQIEMEEKGLERKAAAAEKTVAQQLKSMKKVSILIPDDPQNPSDKVVPIGFNGVIYTVPRGESVEVPEAIAEIYRDSYSRTRATNARIEGSMKKDLELGL
ncbi:hypothetical protein D3C72_1249840 [compost metagenome]